MWSFISNFFCENFFQKPEITPRPCVSTCYQSVHGKRMKLSEEQRDVYSIMENTDSLEQPRAQENSMNNTDSEEECCVIAEIPKRKKPVYSLNQKSICNSSLSPNNTNGITIPISIENNHQSLAVARREANSSSKLAKSETKNKFFHCPRVIMRPSKEIKSRLMHREMLKRNTNFFQESYRLTEKLQYIHLVQSQIRRFISPSKPAQLQIKAKESTIPTIDLTEENSDGKRLGHKTERKPSDDDDEEVLILQEVPKVRSLEDMLKLKPVNPEEAVKEMLCKNQNNKLDLREFKSLVLDTINLSDKDDEDDCFIDEESLKSNPESLEEKLKTLMQITDPSSSKVDKSVEKKYSLPEFTLRQEYKIAVALKLTPRSEVLSEGFGLKITRRDMQTLKGFNWLNDEIINFYMSLIVDRSKNNISLPKVYAFNTFFYPKLASCGFNGLKRWTKQVDIFSYDIILVPVHLGMHWCLAAIDFRCKAVKYYDSIGSSNNECLNLLLHYLRAERFDKKKQILEAGAWEKVNVQNIPQQMNGSDCGVFCCVFAEHLARNCGFYFTQNDMPYFRKKMVLEILEKKLIT